MPISTQITELVRGRLSDLPLVEILGLAYVKRLTGRLRLVRENSEKTILFLNGLPVWAGSDPPEAGLIEILSEVQRLSSDDLMQLKSLQREKGADDEGLIRMFGLATDPEIYELHVEACTRAALSACGWREGRYAFRTGADQVEGKPLYDLNPLTLIYHGIRDHHLQDLPELIQQMQGKFARLNHGWESTLALPGEYYKHSDLLDHFESAASIGEAIPHIYAELGDLNDALLFLYLLLVTGILEIVGDDGIRRPRAAKPQAPAPEPIRGPGPVRFDAETTAAVKSAVSPAKPVAPPATEAAAPAADAAAEVPTSDGTSYIITGKRRKRRRAEAPATSPEKTREQQAPAPAPTVAVPPVPPPASPSVPPPELELPPAMAAPVPDPSPAAEPSGLSDDDWLFAAPTQAEAEAPRAGLGLPEYYSPPSMPSRLLGPDREPDVPAGAPGWGAEPEGDYGPASGSSDDGLDDDQEVSPESELMALPDTEMPYFEEESEARPRPAEPRGIERKKVASALRKTRKDYEELGERLRGDYDHYERLGVEMDADVAEIQAAYDGILDRLALDHLPAEAQAEFHQQLLELSEVASESFKILTDPNERIAIEHAIYAKRKQRSRTAEQQQRLAGQQWRRGKWYLENSSRADLARRCFQEALELDPKPQYFAYVGWALYRNNRSSDDLIEARAYLRQALGQNPHYGEAHYFLGLIAKREGEMEVARNHFQEAMRLNPEDRLAQRELNLFSRSTRAQGILGRMFKRG